MKVYFSQTAGDQITQIIDYLEIKWSEKVRDNFIAKLDKSMDLMASMPL